VLKQLEKQLIHNYFPKGIVVFDLEMTGLSPHLHHIIEIGGIKVQGDKVESFSSLVKPPEAIDEEFNHVHGLTNKDLEGADPIEVVLPKFFDFIKGTEGLWAHNAIFDASFLIYEALKKKIELPNLKVYDSLKLARRILKSDQTPPENFRLGTLMTFFKIKKKNLHRAHEDAEVLLKILLKMMERPTTPKHFEKVLLFNLKDFRSSNLDSYKLPAILKGIEEYVNYQIEIDIEYKGKTIKEPTRPIKPVALLPGPSGLSLYGLCILSDRMKTFRIEKIKSFSPRKSDKK